MDTLVRGKGEWGGERQCNWQYFTFRSGSARGVEVTWGGGGQWEEEESDEMDKEYWRRRRKKKIIR